MLKTKYFLILALASVFITGCSLSGNQNTTSGVNSPEGMVFFYSNSCPHCKDVESFIDQYQISVKLQFDQKEVSSSKENADIFSATAIKCGLGFGVPLFWDGSKCYSGSDEIINFFKAKTGIK